MLPTVTPEAPASEGAGLGREERARRRAQVPRPDPSLPVPEGLVVVDKPQGWTSHDVVGRLRRLCGTRKVGHAGTLDPMATGVLIAGVGRATKLLTYLVGAEKTYAATIRLGAQTTTEDAEGEVTATAEPAAVRAITDEQIAAAVQGLTGQLQQVPSSVSAIKVDGQRSYARVRAGEDVELAARDVTVSRFEVSAIRRLDSAEDQPVIEVDAVLDVSSGTYIRAIARDLGDALGVGGHLSALRRTRVGELALEQASDLETLTRAVGEGRTVPFIRLDDAVRALFPARDLSAQESLEVGQGKRIAASEAPGLIAGFDPQGHVVALLEDRGRPESRTAKSALVFQGQS